MDVLMFSAALHSSVAAASSLVLTFISEARLCRKDGYFISI